MEYENKERTYVIQLTGIKELEIKAASEEEAMAAIGPIYHGWAIIDKTMREERENG